MVVRDRNNLSLHDGDTVNVQTRSDYPAVRAMVYSTTPHNPALEGSALVEFENGSRQWMPGCTLEFVSRT